ncbi:MAG: putative ABC transporter permease [Bacilli bacterium]
MNLLDNGYHLILVYMIAGLAGSLWETSLYLVRDHKFVMSNGSISTPFNFVYGMGGVVIAAVLVNVWKYPLAVYAIGCLLGGFTEYMVATLEEIICHTRSWDYTGRIGSIRGKTTFPIMLLWGILCLFIVYFIYLPLIFFFVNPVFLASPQSTMIYHVIMLCCFGYIIFDLLWVLTLMIRHQQRAVDKGPVTVFGKIADRLFSEEYVAFHFPNAKFDEKELQRIKQAKMEKNHKGMNHHE